MSIYTAIATITTALIAALLFAITQVIICKYHPKLRASPASKTEAAPETAVPSRSTRITHEYEDVDDREVSTAPSRLAIASIKLQEGREEDSFNVEANQAYHVDINDVKRKLNKKKLSRNLKPKI